MAGRDEGRWEEGRGARIVWRRRGEMAGDVPEVLEEVEASEVGCEVAEKALSLELCVLDRGVGFKGCGGLDALDAAIARWMSGPRSTASNDCSSGEL